MGVSESFFLRAGPQRRLFTSLKLTAQEALRRQESSSLPTPVNS